jgi:hypothetical protein
MFTYIQHTTQNLYVGFYIIYFRPKFQIPAANSLLVMASILTV